MREISSEARLVHVEHLRPSVQQVVSDVCVVEGEMVYIYVHEFCNVLLASAVLHTARYKSKISNVCAVWRT